MQCDTLHISQHALDDQRSSDINAIITQRAFRSVKRWWPQKDRRCNRMDSIHLRVSTPRLVTWQPRRFIELVAMSPNYTTTRIKLVLRLQRLHVVDFCREKQIVSTEANTARYCSVFVEGYFSRHTGISGISVDVFNSLILLRKPVDLSKRILVFFTKAQQLSDWSTAVRF